MRAATVLDGVVQRRPIAGHDGRSGAHLERVVLSDGRRLVVKRTRADIDLVRWATGSTTDRELELWRSGVLSRLPSEVGHAVIEAWEDGDETVIVMRDLGGAVLGWDDILGPGEGRAVLSAMAALHRAFADQPVAGLCSLADHLSLLGPHRLSSWTDDSNPLPGAVRRGWEAFADLVPPDVAGAVMAVHDRPQRLARPLAARGTTLLHGDLWPVNMALEDGRVVLIDWGLATEGPPELEVAWFLAGAGTQLGAGREEFLDGFRQLRGERHHEPTLRLALLAGLCELGWNKALDARDHPDPAARARGTADLDWWVRRGREALEDGLVL